MKQSQYIPDGWGFDKWVRPSNGKDPKRIKFFVLFVLVSLFVFGVSSCGAPKELAIDTKTKEYKNIEKNIQQLDVSELDQVVSNAVQKALTEKLKIKLKHVEYDTDKPIDPETGERPKKSETDIDLEKETNELETDSTTIKTNSSTRSELVDKTKDKSKFEGSQKVEEKKGFTFWEGLGYSVGIGLFFGLLIFLIGKWK